MSKIVIIDGNSLLFRAFFATYLDPSNVMRNSEGTPTNAIFAFSNMLASILNTLKKGDGIFVAFDAGKKTFRHKEYAEYKANRPPLNPDLLVQMPIARQLLDSLNIIHYEDEELEADDICGVVATNAAKRGYDVKIYTSDKDYLQLIDDKITIELIKKGLKDIHEMTPQSFKEEWGFDPIQIIDYKGLRGDDSDNLKGIPGVGDKTAKSLIAEFGDYENIIKNANTDTKVGRNLIEFQEDGRICKRLATIVREAQLPYTITDIIYDGYEFKNISEFCNKYEFRNLLGKLPKNYQVLTNSSKKVDFCEDFDLNSLKITNWFSLDLHLEAPNYHGTNILGVGFRCESGTYYLDFETFKKSDLLLGVLKDKDIKKFVFDYKRIKVALNEHGIEIDGLYFDLLLANYLFDSNSSSDLISVLNEYSVDTSQADGGDILLADSEFKNRAVLGAYYALELYNDVINKLDSKNQVNLLYDIEQPLTILLAKMELEGFPIDKETLLQFKNIFQAKVDELTKAIYFLAGEQFNINSPKQVGTILYDKLGLYGPKNKSTSVDALSNIINQHEIVPLILEYRKYTKLISTYIDGFMPFIDKNGKVHPTFNQALTTTGRLSCSEPNLQNISTRDEEGKQIKKAFFYKDDSLNILSLDYSQIELRILAHLSGCQPLIDAFNNGEDIHSATARLVFGLDREPNSEERRKAKAVNFGIVYGISDRGLSEQLDIPVNESRQIIKNFYQTFPEVKAYLNGLVDFAQKNGYAETMFHRRRYLPDINSAQFQLREFAKRASMNAPIQGSAADLIKIAMIRVDEELQKVGYKAQIVSQIHDELILKVNDEEKDKVLELVKNVMENCVQLRVKLKVDGGYAKNWFLAK